MAFLWDIGEIFEMAVLSGRLRPNGYYLWRRLLAYDAYDVEEVHDFGLGRSIPPC